MSGDEKTPPPRGVPGRGSLAPLDVGAVARDDALLNTIGARHLHRTGGLGLGSDAEVVEVVPGGWATTDMGTDVAADDPVVAMLQAFVADLDDQLVPAHSTLHDDDRALGLQVVPDVSPDADRLHTAAKVLTAAQGTRVVREVPVSAYRRPMRHRTAVSSAAAMAIAFTVSLSGVAAAVTGNPLAPYREVLQTVGIAPSDAEVSAEQGVEIGRDLGAADAAIERGDAVLANKFIDEAEASIEEHFDDAEVAAELKDEVVELRQDAKEVEAAAGQDTVIAGGQTGADEALPAPGASTDDPEPSGDPSGEIAPEVGSASVDPGLVASLSADTASSGPTPGSASPSSGTSPSGEPTSTASSSPSSSSSSGPATSSPSSSSSRSSTPTRTASKPPSPTSSTSSPSPSSTTRSPSPSGTATTVSASTPRDKI